MVLVVAQVVGRLRPATEWEVRLGDVLWTLLYGANWHQIAASQDYFAQWQTASPLSHMWSISIEEQFYLAWPVILVIWLGTWLKQWLFTGVAVAALTSTLLSLVVFDPSEPTRTYVGTDTRAHQLFVGAALATLFNSVGATSLGLASRTIRAIGMLGAAALLVSIALLSDSSVAYYRGGSLIVAVAVAALIWSIERVPTSQLARALALPPMAWIGRISYGLYLWHWPAILLTPSALVKALGGRGLALIENRTAVGMIAVSVTLICSLISYYVLERPVRRGRLVARLSPSLVIAVAVLGIAVTLVSARATLELPETSLIEQVASECEAKKDLDVPICLSVNAGVGRPVLAVMGDSVAKSMQPAFAAIARNRGWTFVAAAHNRCTVVIRQIASGTGWESCMDSIPVIQREVLAYQPTVIVVSDNWLPVESYDASGALLPRSSPEHVADIERRLGELVPQLSAQGALVVMMKFTPESAPIECGDISYAGARHCRAPSVTPRFEPYNELLDRIASKYPGSVRIVDIRDVVCPAGECAPKVDEIFLRFDTLHYSSEGARWLVPHLERKLQECGIALEF